MFCVPEGSFSTVQINYTFYNLYGSYIYIGHLNNEIKPKIIQVTQTMG